MDNEMIFIIGQAFGIIAVILGFISYQVKTSKKLLIVNTCTAVVFCIHYFMLGATAAVASNAVCIIRNAFYYNKDKRFFSWKGWPYFFAVCSCVLSIIAWEAWYAIFLVIGISINMVCMSFKDPQNIRKSILVISPIVLIYTILSRSIGGSIYESVSIISSAVGLVRYYKKDKKES